VLLHTRASVWRRIGGSKRPQGGGGDECVAAFSRTGGRFEAFTVYAEQGEDAPGTRMYLQRYCKLTPWAERKGLHHRVHVSSSCLLLMQAQRVGPGFVPICCPPNACEHVKKTMSKPCQNHVRVSSTMPPPPCCMSPPPCPERSADLQKETNCNHPGRTASVGPPCV
jgi:hypothetical protein